MSLLANSNAIESGGYNIDRSLRFRSSASAYLSRTPASASNRTTWTWSGWVKLGKIDQTFTLFRAGVTNDTNNRAEIDIDSYSQSLVFYSADGGVTKNYLVATPVMRDPSAWYHIMCVYDSTNATASNRVKLYMNGSQITALSTATYAAQNTTTVINNNVFHVVSYNNYSSGPAYSDGYLAEVNFIDGQALTPSSFGQTDPVTGVWQPKKYTGTYGTNGFYLNFSDNTSATTLAYDKSGNGNNWTANNISTTAGATYDSMTDVPTLTSATAANFCTLNPTAQGQFSNSYSSTPASATGATLTQGNLYATGANAGTGAYGAWVGTMPLNDGKWYWESTLIAEPTADFSFCGIVRYDNGTTNTPYFPNNGSYTVNDVLGFTWDDTAKELKWYKNGTLQATLVTGATGSYLPWVGLANANVMAFNFGQRPFSYTPPTGFKALNTFNLPDPTIKKPNQYMDATTYTGNGNPNNTTQTITNSGSMQPDFVWIKSRSNAYNNSLFDSVRGIANTLASNSTAAEDTTGTTMLTALNSNGFTVGSNLNGSLGSTNVNGATYVGWQWKKGATPGFDIVTYTGNGAAQTLSHSLGVAPKMMIVKYRSTASNWTTYHTSLGNTQYLSLNMTDAANTLSTAWNNTSPTASNFTVGTLLSSNGATLVAYLFAEIAGFSKFGSYTGNGSADGPFVFTGFRPTYILIKNTQDGTQSWIVYDAARNAYNTASNLLQPNSSDAEATANVNTIDLLSNGFKLRSGNLATNTTQTYIYAAFASNPFKYSNAR